MQSKEGKENTMEKGAMEKIIGPFVWASYQAIQSLPKPLSIPETHNKVIIDGHDKCSKYVFAFLSLTNWAFFVILTSGSS